jgi:tRNA-specific 2-thiouridylase
MQTCTAVALSGGIDSLVTAAILKEQGRRLIGVHFLHGYETGVSPGNRPCTHAAKASAIEHAQRAMQPLGEQLGIPIYIIDLRAEFQSLVVDYFVRTYQDGQTPNPCLVCNPSIKFDVLLKKAAAWGADRMATGHYARIETAAGGCKQLFSGKDKRKDQSYFLARLTQTQLRAAEFPLAMMTKEQTRRIARLKGLIPITSQESQDVCFIKDDAYGDFLAGQPGFKPKEGVIEALGGQVIGRHKGLHRYTIGQRRGLNCPSSEPYYVVRLDQKSNRLVVGRKKDLLSSGCQVRQINWINAPPSGPIQVLTRVRYRHKAVPSTLVPADADRAQIIFEAPEAAVTPGQGAVFYQGEEVLGGGWIE